MKQGWEEKEVGDVLSLEYGKPLPKEKRTPNGLYPVYGANGIKDRTNEFYVEEPSIIVGRKGSAGEINYTEDKFWPLDVTYFTKFDKTELNLDFLFHLLTLLELPKLAKGVKPGINRNDVYAIKTKIPPLDEQKRIVAKLDECFEAIDKARTNVEKNLNNAKELFQSKLNEIFSQKGDGWVEKKLGEVMKVERGGSPRPIKKYLTDDPNGLNWIKIGDATASDKYIYKTKEKITQDGLHKTRYVEEGDFILSNSMSFGKPYIMKTTGCIHDGWLVLKENDEFELEKDYLYHLLCSPNLFLKFDSLAAGSTVRNLNIGLVSSVIIPLPSLTEQKSIVKQLDKIKAQTQTLESKYQQELDALDEMKKSILQKAFSGEL